MAHPPRIDAHHHFWRIARGDYDWLTPGMGAPLYRDYTPDDLAPHLHAAGIAHTVVVQAAATEAETAFLLDLAARTPFVAGVVGWLDMEDPAFGTKLDALMRRPKFVGLRPMLQDLEDDAYITRPAVLANLGTLARRNVPFDILVHPRHLRHVAAMLDHVPDLRAVVDHIAKPAIASGAFEGWAADLAAVAVCPGVHCKLSGMVTEAHHRDWTPADLKPYVDHALTVFGPARSMFGSDWPVCLQAAPYARVVATLRELLDTSLTQTERDEIFGANAARFYNLDV